MSTKFRISMRPIGFIHSSRKSAYLALEHVTAGSGAGLKLRRCIHAIGPFFARRLRTPATTGYIHPRFCPRINDFSCNHPTMAKLSACCGFKMAMLLRSWESCSPISIYKYNVFSSHLDNNRQRSYNQLAAQSSSNPPIRSRFEVT